MLEFWWPIHGEWWMDLSFFCRAPSTECSASFKLWYHSFMLSPYSADQLASSASVFLLSVVQHKQQDYPGASCFRCMWFCWREHFSRWHHPSDKQTLLETPQIMTYWAPVEWNFIWDCFLVFYALLHCCGHHHGKFWIRKFDESAIFTIGIVSVTSLSIYFFSIKTFYHGHRWVSFHCAQTGYFLHHCSRFFCILVL